MNSQHLLDSFLETVLEPDKETINYNGVEVPFPSLAQAELDRQFNKNLKNNVSPSYGGWVNPFEPINKGKLGSTQEWRIEKPKTHYY